jgi:isopentenyl diphosphate isomerase/L-lactate dehydrogenase-like FMN-dependent dehydrogenase
MAEETRKRKADHIRICLEHKAQARNATTGFEDIHLIHKALPEIDRAKINLSTTVFGHKFAAPIIIGAMTGGTEEATKINAAIAETVEKLHLGMGVLAKICEIAGALDKQVIVKETGAGIAAEEARKLEAADVKAIDVGGLGGTSFAAVEYYRTEKEKARFQAEAFWDWGTPTAMSLVEVTHTVKIPVIASGGLRTGTDVAKALALNACMCSLSQPVLEAAVKGAKETENILRCLAEELRNAMFLVGAKDVHSKPWKSKNSLRKKQP